MHFEVVTKRTTNGTLYHARIKGGNGEIIFSSQNYTANESAKHACEIVKAQAASAQIYEVEAS
jgi:uncharacterized protein YegP (UPF0339 family)